jgi:hypothetical protein
VISNKRFIIQCAMFAVFCGAVAVTGFNCSVSKMYSVGSASNDSLSLSKTEDLPYALLNAEQALSSMLNVTGQATPSNGVRNEFNIRNSAFSVNSFLSSMNAPMLLSATSLAGEVCNSLVTTERAPAAVRSFFVGVNFNSGPAQFTPDSYQAVLQQFSQKVWARPLEKEEGDAFVTYYNEYLAGLTTAERTQTAKTSAFYMSVCSAFLSSFDSLIF